MDVRTYYGEYSLEHWINLILKKNIVLPEYQRSFVWKEEDVERLIKSIKEKQFIPPVTIGLFPDSNQGEKNVLLDGQQRLTSILLAYLGYYPEKGKFSEVAPLVNEDDSATDEENSNVASEGRNTAIQWTFRELQNLADNKTTINENIIKTDLYKTLRLKENNLTDDFWKENFIGFSYIVPNTKTPTDIQTYYTRLFRNLNYLGVKLSSLESRKSLYYQNAQLTKYFEGKTSNNEDVLCKLQLSKGSGSETLDFVRYLAILSQRVAEPTGNNVLKGYSAYKDRESYYADYVAYILGLEQEDREHKFDRFKFQEVFPNNEWIERYERLKNAVTQLKPYMNLNEQGHLTSLTDADYWLFGLIYHIVFQGKTLNTTNMNQLISEISNEIREERRNAQQMKSNNRVGRIRIRLNKSIEIYNRYVS